ncbi:MAG: hypothetical protein MUF34_03005 [Polyangiaceae bacterium]|nr:hypothetical protein [Polyangiaceae bacterium]
MPYREAALAFARVRPELDAMPASGLGRITVTIPLAVTIALGALPNIEAKQGEIRALLPHYDYQRAGRLREYAYAAVHAHYRVTLSAEGEVRLRVLVAEAAPLRERLLRSAELHASTPRSWRPFAAAAGISTPPTIWRSWRCSSANLATSWRAERR